MHTVSLGHDDRFITLLDKLHVLSAFAKWVKYELATGGQVLQRDCGLCYNLREWLLTQDTTMDVNIVVNCVFRELIFQGVEFPFGDAAIYTEECLHSAMYLNAKRLAMLDIMADINTLIYYTLNLPEVG